MDAQQQTDAQQHIQRCEDVIRKQMDVIKQQRAEIDRLVSWIMADTDALTCLQAVYNSPTSTENNRIKAASAALPFERAKLSVSVQVTRSGCARPSEKHVTGINAANALQ
jgi:hypothetical protein